MGDMMHIVRMDHVQLAMPAGHEDDARAFYDHLLGISEVAKPPHLAARGGCWFESGCVKVHLGVEENFAPASIQPSLSGTWPPCHNGWNRPGTS